MNLLFDQNLAKNYRSPSQIVRVLTENWLGNHVYCPSCGNASISPFKNNNPVGDFYCSDCAEEYELKSKNAVSIGNTINDGAYHSMIERINANNDPNFFFLSYQKFDYSVKQLILVPKHFVTTDMIIARKPLAMHAKRAGWVGCLIDLKACPASGKIVLINDAQVVEKNKVLAQWQRHLFLRQEPQNKKGWLLAVMQCIEQISSTDFSLADMYRFEGFLQQRFPKNHNIQAKIRQQLQILRNQNVIEFTGRGLYRKREMM